MERNNTIGYEKETTGKDMLNEVLRAGACRMLASAIEAEVQDFVARHAQDTPQGPRQIVRNGYLPRRTVQTGIGPVPVQVPRVRDRGGQGRSFHSELLPPYQRRTLTVQESLPVLYLKGLSTGQFPEALQELFGSDAGLSPASICRLKEAWRQEYEAWCRRDLSAKRFVYVYADGIYFSTRLESDKLCLLVPIGVDEEGNKVPLGIIDGMRENSLNWKELLLGLQGRGMPAPLLAIGDGALGFWRALHEVYPTTKRQRCWVHKTRNVLDKLPSSLQDKARRQLQDIWNSDTKEEAEKELKKFASLYGGKYPKAVECLEKDKKELFTYYAFPGQHWRHIRSTNLIESTFATVRLRTHKTRGCLSRITALCMVFKLLQNAQKRWFKLQHADKLKQLLEGNVFVNGEVQQKDSGREAA